MVNLRNSNRRKIYVVTLCCFDPDESPCHTIRKSTKILWQYISCMVLQHTIVGHETGGRQTSKIREDLRSILRSDHTIPSLPIHPSILSSYSHHRLSPRGDELMDCLSLPFIICNWFHRSIFVTCLSINSFYITHIH